MSYRIPKRIIQFRIGRNEPLSMLSRAVIANVRALNPEFEYMFFDDAKVEQLVERDFPQYRAVFRSFPSVIQRCDFFRYLVVYRYGGFYFDLDVLLASGLSNLLEKGCVFPFERLTFSHRLRELGMDWEIGNYAFGAAAGHPFLEGSEGSAVGQVDDARNPPSRHRFVFYFLFDRPRPLLSDAGGQPGAGTDRNRTPSG
jgi:mannosyltransferase OCH1-like enzyme